MSNEDFGDLLARARSGDREAVEKLIKEYEPHIRRVAHRRLGPELRAFFDTLDMVQSINRSFMLGLKQNKLPITSPEHLIRVVVVMLKRKVARRYRKFHPEAEARQRHEQLIPQKIENPAETVERDDLLTRIMKYLNVRGRRLLELFLQGYSTAEVARIFEWDPGRVRVERARLFKKIRDRFGVEYGLAIE
jgi:RNA polymerase sigma factor (sigma-70 family)